MVINYGGKQQFPDYFSNDLLVILRPNGHTFVLQANQGELFDWCAKTSENIAHVITFKSP